MGLVKKQYYNLILGFVSRILHDEAVVAVCQANGVLILKGKYCVNIINKFILRQRTESAQQIGHIKEGSRLSEAKAHLHRT